jgi:hypothetical protein
MGKDATETGSDKLIRHQAPCLPALTPSADAHIGPPRHVTQWQSDWDKSGLESHVIGGL